MTIGRRNPFEDIEDLFDRMTQEFETMGRQFETEFGSLDSSVAVDVVDRDDEFVVTADLPGFEKDNIDVTLADSTLRIEAERETELDEEDEDYVRRERRRASANRSVRLPEAVDEDGITATYSNGVLTVTLPKISTDDGGRQIEIE